MAPTVIGTTDSHDWSATRGMGSLQDDIRYYMGKRGMESTADLARASGLSWPTVNDVLTGKTAIPRLATLEKLAAGLRIDVSILEESAARSAYGIDTVVSDLDRDVEVVRARLAAIEDDEERAAFVALIVAMGKRFGA